MADQSPLDRATLALLEYFGIQPDEPVPMIGGRSVPALQAYRLPVRAALMAMREPSEAMTAAGGDALRARKVWEAMLDAAILEGPDEMV